MGVTIYKKTATKAIGSKLNAVYAFGRRSDLDGRDVTEGGYCLFVLRDRFIGQAGSLHRTWELVASEMSFADAVKLMNKRVKHKAYSC